MKATNFPKRSIKNTNTSFLLEKEAPKRLEFNKIEVEFENQENIEEECDKSDHMLGPYVKEIFNYVRDNEV